MYKQDFRSTIIVNATAAHSSGALSILKQFITNIPKGSEELYYIFTNPEIKLTTDSKYVEFIPIDTNRWHKRIIWDALGIKKWIKRNHLKPSLIISLQNTGVNLNKSIPQLIYYHQLLPLSNHSWNIKKKDEFILFVYKHFYSLFVSLYKHEKTHFVVQIPSTKKAFLEKFNVSENHIHVIPPEVPSITLNNIDKITFGDNKIHFIYPATLFVYKNHQILLQALHILKTEDYATFEKIKIHFTINKDDLAPFNNHYEIEEAICFEGTIPFKQLIAYYHSMNALLFPSYIESFGLPLLEAAYTGIPIIASDLPYVHDVVGEYSGTTYVDYKDAYAWANAIKTACYSNERFKSFTYPTENGNWKNFFDLVEKLKINNHVRI